jgi:hypothetical protein
MFIREQKFKEYLFLTENMYHEDATSHGRSWNPITNPKKRAVYRNLGKYIFDLRIVPS